MGPQGGPGAPNSAGVASQGLLDQGYGLTVAVGLMVWPHSGCWIDGMASQWLWDRWYGHTGTVRLMVWPHRDCGIDGMASQWVWD